MASDTNGATVDVYLRDRQAGTTERFAPTDCATMGLNYTGGAVSDDGRWLALSSIQCTTGTGGKVTLTDRQTGTVTVVNGMDNALDFSADARYLLADNSNLFRYDRLTNTNTVFVPNTEGGTISASGDSVAYQAQDYYSRYPVGPHPGDTNQALDSFVYQFAAEPRDTTPPVISYELSTPPNEAGWHNAPVTLTWTITDLESSPNSPSGCDPATVNVDGAVTYTCSATSEGGTASQSVTINYDSTPPVIDHTLSTPPNANGWHNANVTIDWLASDVGGSGVTAEPTDTVATTEGANVAYTSPEVCDQAGNCATGSAHLSIDTTVPSQSNFAPAGPQLIVVRNRNFTIDATDAPSGVERVEYYFDTDPGLGNGTSATLTTANTYRGVLDTGTSTPLTPHTLFVRTRDEAGNWSTTFSRTFHEIH